MTPEQYQQLIGRLDQLEADIKRLDVIINVMISGLVTDAKDIRELQKSLRNK